MDCMAQPKAVSAAAAPSLPAPHPSWGSELARGRAPEAALIETSERTH